MNHVAQEILMHYGTPRHSGRYPWGSGKEPYQDSGDFLSRVETLKKEGKTETEIAEQLGLTTTQLRVQKSLATHERRSLEVARAKSLEADGYSRTEIARMMGYNSESSIRSLLNEHTEARMNQAQKTADFLREQIDTKGMIDVGVGVERQLNVSREKLEEALYILEREGYPTYSGRVPQVTNAGKHTTQKVIGPPGTEHKDIYQYENVHTVNEYKSYDDGNTFKPAFAYPKSMDSARIMINYAEDGGDKKDGLIEIRRNVEDLSLGNSKYAQVRILVDNNRYLKGMAMYSDNLPDGVDIVFNTNKKRGTDKMDVLKPITSDPNNPFGSLIKENGGQSYYFDRNGNEQLSLINKRAEEGDWGEWADTLPSQFLSKQNLPLIKKQLNLAASNRIAEYDRICALTNPTVKKILLSSFADECDGAAVHLKAAALPRQKHQVIIPIPSMKDNEAYAPNYNNGEQLALIRFPHGGTFEIPIVTVNNKQPVAKKALENAADAIGINANVANRLSGADFDGDTVMIIPINDRVKITSTPPLEDLKNFDAKMEYPYREGMRLMTKSGTQLEMGKISNLITDMTLKGAKESELARAVKHSMVVIDAEKHSLDYKKSELDNGIRSLRTKYLGRYDEDGRYHEGAATLISRAKSPVSVVKRRGSPEIDPETGEQSWKTAFNAEYIDAKTGETKVRTQRSTAMYEAKDAYILSSGRPQEEAYAAYANRMKALGNQARKEMLSTGKIAYSVAAKNTYQGEVDSLLSKLNIALKNAPREREAQRIANARVSAKQQSNPDMTRQELRKVNQQELTAARTTVGARREPIPLTDREWEAIQAGAVSENVLYKILNNVDLDDVRQRATPHSSTTLNTSEINRIKSMNASGYSTAEIAKALGVSTSTISNYIN